MEFLTEIGPVVNILILKKNGMIIQQEADMTPLLNAVGHLLDGSVSIIGSIQEMNVVMLSKHFGNTGVRDEDQKQHEEETNQHILPPPFHRERIKGDILLIRFGEDAKPQHLTKDEYEAYKKTFRRRTLRSGVYLTK